MRLINVKSFELEEFDGDSIPPYAILSHTWGREEVSLQQWPSLTAESPEQGYRKIVQVCHQARLDELQYVWVDTNCIDKTSSSELSEAINSMYAWYAKAEVCYVFLEDFRVDHTSDDPLRKLSGCRWFSRGWTLQELLAPIKVVFFDSSWESFGDKVDLASRISECTRIPHSYLMRLSRVEDASVAEKMSWLSRRQTTRLEDMSYCVLGLFGINMPLLYGEGPRAFVRLQEEIIKTDYDHTLFCWRWDSDLMPEGWTSLLAPLPVLFKDSGAFRPTTMSRFTGIAPYTMTNAGLSISLPMLPCANFYLAVLNACSIDAYMKLDNERSGFSERASACIALVGDPKLMVWRAESPSEPIHIPTGMAGPPVPLYIGGPAKLLPAGAGSLSMMRRLGIMRGLVDVLEDGCRQRAILPILIGDDIESIPQVQSLDGSIYGNTGRDAKPFLRPSHGEYMDIWQNGRLSGNLVPLYPTNDKDLSHGTTITVELKDGARARVLLAVLRTPQLLEHGQVTRVPSGQSDSTGSTLPAADDGEERWICTIGRSSPKGLETLAKGSSHATVGRIFAYLCSKQYEVDFFNYETTTKVRPVCIMSTETLRKYESIPSNLRSAVPEAGRKSTGRK